MQESEVIKGESIQVNWKGLYEDGKAAWNTLLLIILGILGIVLYLTSQGYFTHRIVDEKKVEVKVLGEANYFGKTVLVSGVITNNTPIEVKLPSFCEINPNFFGKTINVTVATEYKAYNNIEYYDFKDIDQVCINKEIEKS